MQLDADNFYHDFFYRCVLYPFSLIKNFKIIVDRYLIFKWNLFCNYSDLVRDFKYIKGVRANFSQTNKNKYTVESCKPWFQKGVLHNLFYRPKLRC